MGWWIMGHRLGILQRWPEYSICSCPLFLALASMKGGPLETEALRKEKQVTGDTEVATGSDGNPAGGQTGTQGMGSIPACGMVGLRSTTIT